MPSTYTLIKGETIGSSAASYTFTAIPGTFTDLVLRVSARSTYVGQDDYIRITLSADTSTNYSGTELRGSGSAAASASDTNVSPTTANRVLFSTASLSTSNTFSSGEIYIPSYTVSQNKPFSQFGVTEDNATAAWIKTIASLWRNTAAVTSIKLETFSVSTSFVTGSSFYLYGISKS